MDVRAVVQWEEGRITEHRVCNMPDETLDVAQERLEQDLAGYLDEDEWPLDADGLPVAWASVSVLEESN
jgi:hypothetical protein